MSSAGRFFRSPLGAGVIGGVVVGLLGWIAIAAGWIEGENSGRQLIPGPTTLPAAEQEENGKGLTVGQIYERTAPGVAFIEAEQVSATPSPFGPAPGGGGTATGSGFVIDAQGSILTNAHVVEGAGTIRVTLGEGTDPVDAELVGTDPSTDVALLDIDENEIELTPLELGDSDSADIGDPVVAIGNPFGLDRTATTGIVSALAREIQAPDGFTITDVIQHDAAINPGNSGGPLFDAAGRVVGINSQIATAGGGGSVGVGFAVPINTAREVGNELAKDGEFERAFLGVSGADVDEQIADALGLDVTSGALVQEVVPDSPADDAGLRAGDRQVDVDGQQLTAGGDVIVAVDGEEVEGMGDVVAKISLKQPGEEVTLEIVRDGDRQELTVELAARPAGQTG